MRDPGPASPGGGYAARMPTDPASAPRILVALPPGPLRERVLALLADRDVQVKATHPPEQLDATLDATQADVVILDRAELSSRDAAALDATAEDDEAPDVVVLGRGIDESARVDLVASGAAEVIDIAKLGVDAAQTVELLAAGEAGTSGSPTPTLGDFASHSRAMLDLMDLVQRVAPSDSTLLVTGETGVGKEHLARAIHAASPRAGGPFVAVNCGALAAEILESELFGHEAGAFTGARQARQGAFRSADGGTLLLDEIGEMSPAMQVKLLRVLQQGEVRPVGSDKDVHVDVRVIAATNRDLRAEVEAGAFREDLFFRLHVIELHIPPLRERPEDLASLIGSLLRQFRGGSGGDDVPQLDDAALETLLAHPWPGNVRELTNVIERAALVCRDQVIRRGDLPRALREESPAGGSAHGGLDRLPDDVQALGWKEAREEILRRTERAYLDAVLTEVRGVVGDAAARAGLAPRSLYDKMKRHGLRKEDYR